MGGRRSGTASSFAASAGSSGIEAGTEEATLSASMLPLRSRTVGRALLGGTASEGVASEKSSDVSVRISRSSWASIFTIERRGASFAAELKGVTQLLDRPVCPATSPSCRATLGDRACRVDLAPLTHIRRVVAVEGRVVTLDAAAPHMAFGELLWIEGANCGLASPVIAADGAALHLAEAPAFLPAAPVRVRLTEGCDKQLATCRDRFANAVNFRGEAHLPGNDLLTRYPGG